MTREEMCKFSFKPYMAIEVRFWRQDFWIECLLCAIDFDKEVATLQLIDANCDKEDFQVSISNIRKSRKLKVVKK